MLRAQKFVPGGIHKDALGNFGIDTARSLARFVRAEAEGNGVSYGADFVSLWLLTVDFNEDTDNIATVCTALNNDQRFPDDRELLWHQAYLPDGTECNWFRSLWQPPYRQSVSITQAQVPPAASTATPSPQPTATPFPTPTVDPARAAVQALQQLAPDAPVYLGEATEVITRPSLLPPNYTYRRFIDGDTTRLVITNTLTGEATPLGNDQGTPYFYGMTDKHVLWAFLCHKQGCDPEDNPPLPTGYYLYNLETRTNRVFTAARRHGGLSVAQLSGDWIAFARPETGTTVHLYAINVRTQEELLITDSSTFPELEAPYITTDGVFTLADDVVVWAEQEKLYRYNLTTGISETLHVPALLTPPKGKHMRDPSPRLLGTSEQAVVWSSQWEWWGYDFETDHYFPIPPSAPGWGERAGLQQSQITYATMREDTVYWRMWFLFEGGREEQAYFAAPLVRPK